MALTILPTGIPGLDTVLGGGLPRGTLLVIAGSPGTGKTILSQQLCFCWAAAPERGKALYFSVLSEPHEKLLAYLEAFSFFDPEALGTHVDFLSLQAFLDQSLDATATAVVRQARQAQAGLVVIDGFQALESISPDRVAIRNFLYKLSAQLNLLGTTTIVTLERPPEDADSYGEFATADGVITLATTPLGWQDQRQLQIRKLRGRAHLPGRHSYQMTISGCVIYPRLEALSAPDAGTEADSALSCAFNLPELDQLLAGGLPRGTATLLTGSTGTGKTLLGLYYLQAGLAQGEPGIYLGFRESRSQLAATARRFRLALDPALLTIQTWPPFEMDLDQISTRLREEVERTGARRVVIDSMDEFEAPAARSDRATNFLAALHTYLRGQGVTSLFLKAIPHVITPGFEIGDAPLAQLCENLLVLRYVSYRAELYRVLAAIKMRDRDHDRAIREYTIRAGDGLRVLGPAESTPEVLTGITDQLRPAERAPRRRRRPEGADDRG